MKVHFIIFCNCAQFLMKAAKVHCCAQYNEMNVEIYDENKISNFHVSHTPPRYPFIFPSDFICCHSILHPVQCIKYRKLLKST